MSKKIFLVDVARCNGCHNCQIACKDEHCGTNWLPYAAEQPDTGQFWCKVEQTVHGSVPKVNITYMPLIGAQTEGIRELAPEVLKAETDEFGDFWFRQVEGERYHLWFEAEGYATREMSADATEADCNMGVVNMYDGSYFVQ